MTITRALAEKSDEVQPAATRHQADTDIAHQAIQLIAERLRSSAVEAGEIASFLSDHVEIATNMKQTGPEEQRC